jgi:hypothetical protein
MRGLHARLDMREAAVRRLDQIPLLVPAWRRTVDAEKVVFRSSFALPIAEPITPHPGRPFSQEVVE